MKVEVVFVAMEIFHGRNSFFVSLPENATAEFLLRFLENEQVEKSYKLETDGQWNVLGVLDGCVIGPNHVLKDGDKIQFFPAMTGG